MRRLAPWTLTETDWILSKYERYYRGTAVEVGAFDGQLGSLTMALEFCGWKTLAIEPNPDMEPALKDWRDPYWMGACANFNGRARFYTNPVNPSAYSSLDPSVKHHEWRPSSEEQQWREVGVEVATLDRVLLRFGITSLDAVTIDTEGTELDVLKGLDLGYWKPKQIVCESWDDNGPTVDYLKSFGYVREHRVGVNDLFLLNQ